MMRSTTADEAAVTDTPAPADRPAADPLDPRGLIRDAFDMRDIGEADCRSIFFDWALGLPPQVDPAVAIPALLTRHAEQADHPMRRVLEEGLRPTDRPRPRRRRAPPAEPV